MPKTVEQFCNAVAALRPSGIATAMAIFLAGFPAADARPFLPHMPPDRTVGLAVAPALEQPSERVDLRRFGAVGDGRTDDTRALSRALAQAAGRCLDGRGRSFRVRGTLRASGSLCLVDARLLQDVVPVDTRPFITGTCPTVRNPDALGDCGDPAVRGALAKGLRDYLETRTLLIRPADGNRPLSVVLRNVEIDRGADPASGSRDNAAGLWIDGADGVVLDRVTITGAGKGFGVLIADSRNVVMSRLHVHDLTWAPYAGDAPLNLARAREGVWNGMTIREFRSAGSQGAGRDGFFGLRIQEQLAAVMIVRSRGVTIKDARIENCTARLEEGDLPWQADGIAIGDSSSDIVISGDTRIRNTWEGVDVVGGGRGVRNLAMSGLTVTNAFGYAVKWGYDIEGAVLSDSRISQAGLAGIVIYGQVRDAAIRRTALKSIGDVQLNGRMQVPWPVERGGVLIAGGAIAGSEGAFPRDVVVDRVTIAGGRGCSYGFRDRGGRNVRRTGGSASGCGVP